ncbi:hypothetical protein [Rathayibacter festucae]|uniref:hypothetical protein n=1 Tax=Rathayibacter festucae TaxID=110937 RepID=UPI002A69C731|nr:hypothetical protein [Rathayibacter festucae]MDY0912864.1 hypothetical protein [Rathayibacter festucae]
MTDEQTTETVEEAIAVEPITLQTELPEEEAVLDIAKAVSARHSIARKYVMRLRRKRPDASPADLVRMLERHYGTSITAAGALISAGAIAADVGIAMIPGVGAAAAGVKSAGAQAAKKATKEATKSAVKAAAKNVALGAAKSGAQRAASLLPAGDEQLQFEITAIFALAIADIHGMDLDQDQAQALVYGLTNDRVGAKQIAVMATDVAAVSAGEIVAGPTTAVERSDWATTLASSLPAGRAQSLVRTIQTGQLDGVRDTLSGKQQAAVDYGVGALSGGIARFVFGREVINASRTAFAEAPEEFPARLALSVKIDGEDDPEQNRALAALEDAAKSTGTWVAGTAGAVGDGVATAAGAVSRPFRSVDLDGDGIPDEAQALTAVKGAASAVAGAADAVGGKVAGLFKRKRD